MVFFHAVWDPPGFWYDEWYSTDIGHFRYSVARLYILFKSSVLAALLWYHSSSGVKCHHISAMRGWNPGCFPPPPRLYWHHRVSVTTGEWCKFLLSTRTPLTPLQQGGAAPHYARWGWWKSRLLTESLLALCVLLRYLRIGMKVQVWYLSFSDTALAGELGTSV